MVFGVGSTGDDSLRSDKRSPPTVVVEFVEVRGQQFMKKWWKFCCNDMVCVQNSGLIRAEAEEEESTEEKQGRHG